MARPLRIEFAGAKYHVMCRGNNGGDIFFGDEGREIFLNTLDEVCVRSGWLVHAYVLMGNHYHLLLETPEGNLVAGMKWFQGTYTQRINAWQKRRGHLFQGRYTAQLVNGEQRSEDYFQLVSEYIHLNPARAGLIGKGKRWKRLKDYQWSSFPLYCGWKNKRPDWLVVDRVMGSYQFKDQTAGRRAYENFLEARTVEVCGGDEEAGLGYKQLRRGWCVGDADFRSKMLDLVEKAIEGKKKESFSGDVLKEHGEEAANGLLALGMKCLGLNEKNLQELGKSAAQKKILACWLSNQTLVSAEWIAKALSMGHSSSVSRAKNWVKENKSARKSLEKLAKSLAKFKD